MKKNTLILGIGNTLLSDEGTGIHMLGYLREIRLDCDDISYVDGGTLSFTLMPYIESAHSLIVIDAAELNAAPGTVRVFRGEEMDRFAGKTKRSVHEVSLGDLLAIAHLTDSLPRKRALVAVQPHDIDWGDSLSDPVTRALSVAAEHIEELLHEWQDKQARATGSGGFQAAGVHS